MEMGTGREKQTKTNTDSQTDTGTSGEKERGRQRQTKKVLERKENKHRARYQAPDKSGHRKRLPG